jgi:hypothetical protein
MPGKPPPVPTSKIDDPGLKDIILAMPSECKTCFKYNDLMSFL